MWKSTLRSATAPRLSLLLVGLFQVVALSAQSPAVKESVQVNAVASTAPSITLSWPAFSGATGYTVHRKLKTASAWTQLGTAASSATQYVDNSAATGTAYEYKVVRTTSSAGTGYGCISSGIQLPVTDYRGKMVLLVDNTFSTALATQLTQLVNDLRADGWVVLRSDVSRTASVPSIRSIIQTYYNADPTNVKAVFLFGHVPVPYSGQLNPDGHGDHVGAWPADGYYGDMNGTWTDNSVNATGGQDSRNHNVPGDGKFDQSDYPSALELQVGRVDMSQMESFQYYLGLNEQTLLGNYLTKLHNFKIKQTTPTFRGAVFDNFEDLNIAGCGYRNVSANVGTANTSDLNSNGTPFGTTVNNQSYLWTYACGGGTWISASNIATTDELCTSVTWGGVFNMMLGSYYGDWDCQNNLMRAVLGRGAALTNCFGGIPNVWFHHMGMGDNIGYSMQASMNNGSVYAPQACGYSGGSYNRVHMGLMGDPSLRQVMVSPPSNVQVTNSGGHPLFTWTAASGSPIGYHIYDMGATTTVAPVRLTTSPVTGTSWTASSVTFVSGRQYSVRAVKLETAPTGTFYNMSLGAFGTASGTAAPDCLGVVGGTATVGSGCNDNNACSASDVYNASCQCTGTSITPTANITASGSTSICSGGNVLLNASTGTGYTYVWKKNGTAISGATSVSYSATTAGSYTVVITSSGCSATSSAISVTVVTGSVSATLTAGGSTTFCTGGSVTLSANTGTGLSYVWKRSGTTISGATASTYAATQSGSYTVTITSGSCSATSSSITATVNTAATATITPTGSTSFCTGGSVVLNASTGVGYSYVWKNNGTTIGGATSASYTATAAGSYTVVVSSSGCSSATSSSVNVTIGTGSATAQIWAYAPTAICPGGGVLMGANTGTGLTYAWKRNGTTISGATLYWYTATQTGSYTVAVASGGCSATSNTINVTSCTTGMMPEDEGTEAESERAEGEDAADADAVTGVEPVGAELPVFVLYPNPSSGVINMLINDPGASVVEVSDLTGRNMLSARYTRMMDVSVLPSGAYVVLIRAFDGKPLARARLVKE